MGSGRESTEGLGSCLGQPRTLIVPLVLRRTHSHTSLTCPPTPVQPPWPRFSMILPGPPDIHLTHGQRQPDPAAIDPDFPVALKVCGTSSDIIQNTHSVNEVQIVLFLLYDDHPKHFC